MDPNLIQRSVDVLIRKPKVLYSEPDMILYRAESRAEFVKGGNLPHESSTPQSIS